MNYRSPSHFGLRQCRASLHVLLSIPLKSMVLLQAADHAAIAKVGQLAEKGAKQAVITPIEIHKPVRSVWVYLEVAPRGTQREWSVRPVLLETEPLVDLLHSRVARDQGYSARLCVLVTGLQDAQQDPVGQCVGVLAITLRDKDSFRRVVEDDIADCFLALENAKEPITHEGKASVIPPVDVIGRGSETKAER